MILPILKYPNPLLFTATKDIDIRENEMQDEHILSAANDMMETLRSTTGVGIAANQVGIEHSIFIMQVDNGGYITLLNPEIIYREGEQASREGCLSLGKYRGKVTRSLAVTVKAYGLDGVEFTTDFIGFEATVVQHEIDHLRGKVFIDNMSKLKQTKAIARIKKDLK